MTGLAENHLPAGRKGSVTEQVAIVVPQSSWRIQASAFDLTQARQGGKSVYLIEYDLIHDIQRRG